MALGLKQIEVLLFLTLLRQIGYGVRDLYKLTGMLQNSAPGSALVEL
jgi:hypothetical protein